MKISVIMLTYNRKDYLGRMVEAILNQTFDEFEFIIVDNGSSDGTSDVLEKYKRKDSRIKIITIEKSSIATGRKVGLEASNGEYITFVDDDDWVENAYLENFIDAAEKNNADIVYGSSIKMINGIIEDNCIVENAEILDGEHATVKLLERKECNSGLPNKLFRKKLFKKITIREDVVHEDIFVTYKLFINSKIVATVVDKNYCAVRHGDNISAFTNNDKLLSPLQLEEYFEAFSERSEYIAKINPKLKDFAKYTEWSYMISMCNKIETNRLLECKKQLQHIKTVLSMNYEAFYYSSYIKEFEKKWMDEWIKI